MMNPCRFIAAMVIAVTVITTNSTGYSEPSISKSKIPPDLAAEVKKELEGLYSKDPVARANAAMALREFRADTLQATIPFLMGMLQDNDKLKISVPFNPFGGIQTSPGEEAAKTLGKIGEEAVAPLAAALQDKNRHVRKSAIVGLGETGHLSAADPLLILIKKEPYSDVMATAVEALGKIPSPKVVEPLIAALEDKDWSVREAASGACKNIKDARSVAPLLRLLKAARANNKITIVNNVESALGDITNIYGSDKDKEWDQWLSTNQSKTQ